MCSLQYSVCHSVHGLSFRWSCCLQNWRHRRSMWDQAPRAQHSSGARNTTLWTQVRKQSFLLWNLSNVDTFGTEETVLISEVSWFQGSYTNRVFRTTKCCSSRPYFWMFWIRGSSVILMVIVIADDYLRYACGIVCEYLTEEMATDLSQFYKCVCFANVLDS